MTIAPDGNTKDTNNIDLTDDESPDFAWPTVVAVVVSSNPGDWLENALESITLQDYPDLTTLVVDVCSDEDLSTRVATAMPSAFVRRIDEKMNFAQAVNEAVNSIEGATYILICHDDVVLGKYAIAELVEEAFRSNASIVGPKILDGEHPDRLLEVGNMIDRFGVPFRGIEPEEVDQGQHDGVRDVFFVSSAAMLVRADLFRALGGFDTQCFPGAEDIDLAWRAHLVGARVLVQPDAVVKHHLVSDRQRKSRTSTTPIVARHRMRAVIKNASIVSLLWILPLALILHFIEGIVWTLRGRPMRAWLLFSGWIWNIRHLSDTRKQRKAVQKTREVSDRSIASYQVGGSARIRRFFTSIGHNRQLKKIAVASRTFATNRYDNRTRETPMYLVAMAIYLIAVRALIFSGISSIGGFVPWPNLKEQVNALINGSLPVSKEPMLSSVFGRILMLLMTTLSAGKPGLAHTLFVVSLVPIGGFGIRLLLRDRGIDPRSIAISAITYGMFALCMYAFSFGDFGSIVMLGALPYFLYALSKNRLRQLAITSAVMIAFSSTALMITCVIGFIYICFPRSNSDSDDQIEKSSMRSRFLFVFKAGLIAGLINIGLAMDLVRHFDRNAFGFTHNISSFSDFIADTTTIKLTLLIAIPVVVCALLIGKVHRTQDIQILTITTTFLLLLGFVCIYFGQPVYNVSALYVVVQLAVALSLGVALNSYRDEMKKLNFGVLHLATFVSILLVLASVIMTIPVLHDGTFSLPSTSWADQIDVQKNERVLYLGDSRSLIGSGVIAPYGRSFSLSLTSPSSATAFVGPASSNDDDIRHVYSAIIDYKTNHGGLLLSQLGIGTIVVPTSQAPGRPSVPRDIALLNAFDQQIDLVRLKDRQGLVVYKNMAFSKSITPNVRPIVNPVDIALSADQHNSVAKTESVSVSMLSVIAIAISALSFLGALFWRRRHRLLEPISFRKFGSNKAADVSKELDLNVEHDNESIDQEVNRESVKEEQDIS